ncbi:MAG: hypothetical protein ACRDJM_04325, partial [Actinomycetota bacterium]
MIRRIGVCLLVLALAGAACSNKTENTKGVDNAKTYTVQVDAKKAGQPFNLFADAFFPKELKVRAGDTVDFKLNWSGVPHTVTFGTLIDQGTPKFDPKADEEPAEWTKIPRMLPRGPGDANQTSANPCFIATGDPPKDGCPAAAKTQPEFTGTFSMYNSGFMPPDSTFSVAFAKSVAPGTYNFFCALHRGAMTGKVTVAAERDTVLSPADVDAATTAEIAKAITTLTSRFDSVKAAKPGAPAGSVFAGWYDRKVVASTGLNAGVTVFGPKDVEIKTGGLAAWKIAGPHSIAFNPPQDAVEFLVKGPDGAFHL